MRTTPGGTIRQQQFPASTADETYGTWVNVSGCAYVVFYITGVGTTSSGVITFEECAPVDLSIDPPVIPSGPQDIAGYAPITTYNASNVTAGLQGAVHLPAAAYCFVRARISTVIGGGGTISVGLVAY